MGTTIKDLQIKTNSFMSLNEINSKMTPITNTLSSNLIVPPLTSSHHLNFITISQFPKTPFHKHLNKLSSSKPSVCFPQTSTSDSPSSNGGGGGGGGGGLAPPVVKKKKRYRKEYPGESKGITEEMRFVAMRLHNDKGSSSNGDDFDGVWVPTIDGFLKYLVDTKLVFETIEGVVEHSTDVSYTYFRKTGLERSESLARDLEWFSQEGLAVPEPSKPGISYASYLKKLAENSAPLFLSHFYNVYFSHLAGGQVIAKQVAEKLVEGRQLEFFSWEGDEEEFLKQVRNKLNMLGEHWSRDDRNKCLKEATKSFRYLGQIVRLIIL